MKLFPFHLGVLCALAPALGLAQETVPQPAEAAREQGSGDDARADGQAPEAERQRSFEAPSNYEVVITAPQYRDDEPIGAYGQPRFTAKRRFPTTRLYVVPAGTMQVEWWLELKGDPRQLRGARYRSQYELEFGLGYRLQMDIYLTTQQKGFSAPMALHREKVELRYALADWGAIPTNPTLYLEVARQHDAPPLAEVKILLGDRAGPGLYWGVNLVFEHELGGEHEHEYAVTAGLSKTIADQVFSFGLELKVDATDVDGARFAFSEIGARLGPSLQWRPVPPMHLDLVIMGGVGLERAQAAYAATPLLESLCVVGWEL